MMDDEEGNPSLILKVSTEDEAVLPHAVWRESEELAAEGALPVEAGTFYWLLSDPEGEIEEVREKLTRLLKAYTANPVKVAEGVKIHTYSQFSGA